MFMFKIPLTFLPKNKWINFGQFFFQGNKIIVNPEFYNQQRYILRLLMIMMMMTWKLFEGKFLKVYFQQKESMPERKVWNSERKVRSTIIIGYSEEDNNYILYRHKKLLSL